ncbi:CoA transferase, partial [Pseudonocardia pini]|uniref:CoA transferase n=1 Tax=Pseudonocardia pini TaxID=2758030 RepID=UPI0015F00F6D
MATPTSDLEPTERPAAEPLAGLTVLDLTHTTPGGWVSQFLADGGADVLHVEPPGGSRLRRSAAWPALARGSRSLVLDAADPENRDRLLSLVDDADVVLTSFRPATATRLGLTPEELAERNPAAVVASITGWGRRGPWSGLKGYEGLVMAKTGIFHAKRLMQPRPGPAFVSVPYASWGAAQTALHGILAALLDRQRTGLGQVVEADLVRGVYTLDTWDWYLKLVGSRWPDAYEAVEAFSPEGVPGTPLIFPLLAAPTKDGRWLQFGQTQPRLFVAMMQEFGLSHLFTDPKWKGLPALESPELRVELWETMINKVGERTLDEWNAVMAANPDISAELFRAGPESLDHPQMLHDGRKVVGEDGERGPVHQPSTLVHADGQPL